MSSTFSTNLALELIGTGDQAGAWGNTTNTNLGTLIEQAISGYVTQAVATGTDTTITIPNGATGVARNMYLELTGTGGTNTNLIVPANKKLYFIYNNASGAVTVKVSGQTGVSVGAGEKKILVSNGTDVIEATSYLTAVPASVSITTLTATSANITTLTGTSATITTLSSTSTTITTLVGTSATITTLTGTSANIGNIAFSSATVTTTGTNQNLVLNPNGNGAVLVNSTTDSGFSANAVALEAIASASGLVHPFLSKALDAVRSANICWNAATSGDNQFVSFGTEGTYTARGSITYNRGAGQVAYNTTSDRRAKTISGPVTNSGQVIDQLKVYNGKMNWGTIEFPMMIADEAQQTTPYCVTGKPNAVDAQGNPIYQQIDYSALVPLLLAEVQSLRARVVALEATP